MVKYLKKIYRKKRQRFMHYVQFIKFMCSDINYHFELYMRFKNIIHSYDNLIDSRIRILYFKSFISTIFNVEEKLKIMIHHYRFMQEFIEHEKLLELFRNGIKCWS